MLILTYKIFTLPKSTAFNLWGQCNSLRTRDLCHHTYIYAYGHACMFTDIQCIHFIYKHFFLYVTIFVLYHINRSYSSCIYKAPPSSELAHNTNHYRSLKLTAASATFSVTPNISAEKSLQNQVYISAVAWRTLWTWVFLFGCVEDPEKRSHTLAMIVGITCCTYSITLDLSVACYNITTTRRRRYLKRCLPV